MELASRHCLPTYLYLKQTKESIVKILIALDGSDTSIRALRYVIEHRDVFGASPDLLLVHVHMPIPTPRAEALLGAAVIKQYYQEESENVLAPARLILAGTPCNVEELSLVGEPAGQIITAAQKHDCDMILIGIHGRSAIGNFFLGSVAMRVIAASPTPVLSVK